MYTAINSIKSQTLDTELRVYNILKSNMFFSILYYKL